MTMGDSENPSPRWPPVLEMREPGTWPDGVPIRDWTAWVMLSCGHYRVSRGWRGDKGEGYCCDVCHLMTTIARVYEVFDAEPFDWRMMEYEQEAKVDPLTAVQRAEQDLARRVGNLEAWQRQVKEERTNAPFGLDPAALASRLLQLCDVQDEQFKAMCLERDAAWAANARAEEAVVKAVAERDAMRANAQRLHERLDAAGVPTCEDMGFEQQAVFGGDRLAARIGPLLVEVRKRALAQSENRYRGERMEVMKEALRAADDYLGGEPSTGKQERLRTMVRSAMNPPQSE